MSVENQIQLFEPEETILTCDHCNREYKVSGDYDKDDYLITCDHCGDDLCEDCQIRCHNCDTIICENCSRKCNDCCKNFCPNCMDKCEACREYYCKECLECCNDCGRVLCGDCGNTCQNCEEVVCHECITHCDRCGESVCQSCCDDRHDHNDEPTLEEYSYNDSPQVLDYSYKPDWVFYKQVHENTLYLGIELEMNFSLSKFNNVFGIVKNYLCEKFIFKNDSSIGEGAELVITPHTLQKLHTTVNFREMFKRLIELGARSHESGKCGLHVHVNRKEVSNKDLLKLKHFFVKNRQQIIKFSQRGDNLNYCKIPITADSWHESADSCSWNQDRYVALNDTGRTLEYRIFRGTLNYERFKASLEFVQATIEFVKTHGTQAIISENSWCYFKEFISKRYHILSKHLKKRGL